MVKTQEISLRDLDYYFINLPEHTERCKSLVERLLKIGIDKESIYRIEGIRKKGISEDSVYVGCFHSQLKALKYALEKNKSSFKPFVILEDDAVINRFPSTIQIPKDAHSVYLGLSSWALDPQLKTNLASNGTVVYERINNEIVRIYNMLSSHAIMYLDIMHIKSLIDSLENNLNEGNVIFSKVQNIPMMYYGTPLLPCDVIMANQQSISNVYALRDPIFYQDDKHKYCTLIKF
jgi:hypothetical protein